MTLFFMLPLFNTALGQKTVVIARNEVIFHLLIPSHSLHFCQQAAEFTVIDFHTVVEVEFYFLVCVVAEFFVKLEEPLCNLCIVPEDDPTP